MWATSHDHMACSLEARPLRYIYDNGKHDYKMPVGSHFNLAQWMIVALRHRLVAGEEPGLTPKVLIYLHIHMDRLAHCPWNTEKQKEQKKFFIYVCSYSPEETQSSVKM